MKSERDSLSEKQARGTPYIVFAKKEFDSKAIIDHTCTCHVCGQEMVRGEEVKDPEVLESADPGSELDSLRKVNHGLIKEIKQLY